MSMLHNVEIEYEYPISKNMQPRSVLGFIGFV